ncbi:MAG: hypothetical protein K0S55_302 [Clostridia bacterium]|nr:hypothetical protein [Clostridia bacterium]
MQMKKTILLITAAILTISILSSCGEANKNPGITSIDLTDASATQQRWLRLPESNLIINPDSLGGTDNSDLKKLPLNIGILDTTGDTATVKNTVNDALFIMEDNSANGKGGTDIFTAIFAGEGANMSYNNKNLNVDSTGEKITMSVNPACPNVWEGITFKKPLDLNLDKDVIIDIDIAECIGRVSLKGNLTKPSIADPVIAQDDAIITGHRTYSLSDVIKNLGVESGMAKLNFTIFAIDYDKNVVINSFKIKEIDRGFHVAADNAKTEWSPSSIKSTLTYPNGSYIETTDFFIDNNTIGRKIRAVDASSLTLGGKIYGKSTYDSKANTFNFEADGFKYVIAPKRKLNVTYFDSEADMLTKTNGSAEPKDTSAYWTVSFGNMQIDDEVYIAISMSTELGIDEMNVLVKEGTSSIKSKASLEERITFWDEYLVNNEITPEYILNSTVAE